MRESSFTPVSISNPLRTDSLREGAVSNILEDAPVRIREAESKDFPEMARIGRESVEGWNFMDPDFRESYARLYDPVVFARNLYRTDLYRSVNSFVAEKDGAVIGFYITCDDAPDLKRVKQRTGTHADALSHQFFVAPGERDRFVGTLLRIEGVRNLIQRGKKTMLGYVFEDNSVLNFYEAMGAKCVVGSTLYADARNSSGRLPHCEGAYYLYKLPNHLDKLERRLV